MKKEKIKALLPSVFQTAVQPGNPLFAILDVMETMHAPSEAALDRLPMNFNPYRTPDAFVAYLADWVDLGVLLETPRATDTGSTPSLSTGVGRLRELVAAAVTLSRWRGTCKGLKLFLQTATGFDTFQIDEQVAGAGGKVRPFHLRITAPGQLADHRAIVERIIELEKPAYVTYELKFAA